MKKRSGKYNLVALVITGLVVLLSPASSIAGKLSEVSYLYRLSTFTGTAPVGAWPKLRMDRTNNEIYVLTDEDIRVFNQNGMEIYQISSILDETAGEQTIDVAVKEDGTIIFLTSSYQKGKIINELVLGNYRGEPVSRFVVKNLPPELGNFQPDRIIYQGGLLYLANLSKMQIITVDKEGGFQRYYDILSLVRQLKNEDTGRFKRKFQGEDVDWDMGDFAVDKEGNILFTIPVAGNVYKLTKDLQLVLIGRRGGGPDKFGIPVAIISDDEGNYLVSDVLQSVVKVFDKDLNFVGVFGGRNNRQDALFSPRGLAVDTKNRVYVSQTERAGVSVFQLIDN